MKFFAYFPDIAYPVAPGETRTIVVKNLMNRFRVRNLVKSYATYYYTYDLQEGDRPDIIAHKYYGSPDYAWLVYLANDIVDPHFDWPLNYVNFQKYLVSKYGSLQTAYQTVHAYKDGRGNIIMQEDWTNLPENDRSVQYKYDYEMELNDAKRSIRLIDNYYMPTIISEVRRIFQ